MTEVNTKKLVKLHTLIAEQLFNTEYLNTAKSDCNKIAAEIIEIIAKEDENVEPATPPVEK